MNSQILDFYYATIGSLLASWLPIIAFLAPIIGGGELGVIAVAFLGVNSVYSFFIVSLFSFIGMMCIDSFWFGIMRTNLLQRYKEKSRFSKKYKALEKHIEKITDNRDSLIIFISKILIGTRILLMIYLGGKKNLPFRRFLWYNTLPTLIWSVMLTGIGFLAAHGFVYIIETFRNIQLAVTFLFAFIVIFYILLRIIRKWLMKRRGRLE